MGRPGTCTIPGCPRPIYTAGICGSHLWRLRIRGDTYPNIPIGELRGDREERRPQRGDNWIGFCVCRISRPEPKVCAACGKPCIYRMSEATRAVALKKLPNLRTQQVAPAEQPEPERAPGR